MQFGALSRSVWVPPNQEAVGGDGPPRQWGALRLSHSICCLLATGVRLLSLPLE